VPLLDACSGGNDIAETAHSALEPQSFRRHCSSRNCSSSISSNGREVCRLLIQLQQKTLNRLYFAFLEAGFAALPADPGGHGFKRQVVIPCGRYEKARVSVSSLPGNACISCLSPRSEVRTPLALFPQIRRNHRQIIVFRSADHMDCPPQFARAQHQATAAASISRIKSKDDPQ
jgi:hypothetical protein